VTLLYRISLSSQKSETLQIFDTAKRQPAQPFHRNGLTLPLCDPDKALFSFNSGETKRKAIA